VVERVLEGTPAARAGVAPGDRLLDLDGVPVEDADAETGFIQRRAPGTEVRLRLRGPDGTERDARVRLGELAAQPRLLFNGLGVQERESFDTSAARFAVAGVPGGRRVVVSSVDEGCSAACAGIRAGDWIVEIAGTPVLSASDYGRLATDACAVAECVEVTVYRAGEEQRRKVVLK
jgi:S1-C subfamily serine protease